MFVEPDINSYRLVTDLEEPLVAPVLSEDRAGRVWQLMELRFARLEALILTLKKRIYKFEENEHLAQVCGFLAGVFFFFD